MKYKQPILAPVVAITVFALSACSDDNSNASTTTAPSTSSTMPVTTTTSMGTNIESLSYLIQGLMNTEDIGGEWVDQGRQIVPPGSNQLTGYLCEEGEAAVAALEGRFDPQVSTSFRRPNDVGLNVFETLMWGERDQIVEDFETFTNAVELCDGKTYTTTDLGQLTLIIDDVPELGTAMISFRFGPPEGTLPTPWLEQRSTMILLSDLNEPVALVVGIGASVIHDEPKDGSSDLEQSEYERIAKAAVDRILEGL